jgi:XapX domain-containing protein
MKIVLGIILGLLIGAGCRWFDIPVPSPPKLVGALLVVAMTVGYIFTDRLITTKFSARGPTTTQSLCGGPSGQTAQPSHVAQRDPGRSTKVSEQKRGQKMD